MSSIKIFNSAFIGSSTDYNELSKLAYKVGYLVSPLCSTIEVLEFLQKQVVDYGSTFYKSFDQVASMSRWELFLDQVAHYASTYGTNYTGEMYVPKGFADIPAFTTFKVIMPITKKEAIKRCEAMLVSGIALSQETIEDVLAVLGQCNHTIDINIVKNKEAKMWLYKATGTTPSDAVEMVRYLIFIATENSLLIKDKQTIEAIKIANLDISKEVESFGLDKMSSVFLRFKPLFLAFKKANPILINRLRKLAIKNHKPTQAGYWESILSNPELVGQLPIKLLELNNFKKVTLLEAIKVRLSGCKIQTFGIRNGKIWLSEEVLWKDEQPKKTVNREYLKFIETIIYQSLVDSMKLKATRIQLPIGVNLTLPKSEKSFVGNFPLGTTIDLSNSNAIVGINWRGQEGASDLDLALVDIDGTKFGWNANYTNQTKTVVYSGDMTSANPEATELMFASNGFKPSIVKVNLYTGNENSKFKFFVAKSDYKGDRNPTIDPNDIVVSVDLEMESKEMSLGVITENKFHIAKFRTGNGQVAGDSVTNKYINYVLETINCYVDMKTLLIDSGFILVNSNSEIDLTNLSKDSLIKLIG